MSAKHTPGPWSQGTVGEGRECVWLNGRTQEARGYDREQEWIDCNTEANARLIAAAPELLEALIELADCGAEAWGEDRPCVRIARDAIAKATGGKA